MVGFICLQTQNGKSNLKIADFGFSSHFFHEGEGAASFGSCWNPSRMESTPQSPDANSFQTGQSPLKVLKSVVGSPFYVAPEVLQAGGYDGPKADVWSLGIILYAMLAGNLPFDQEIANCKRFKNFGKWVVDSTLPGMKLSDNPNLAFPDWMFPPKFSKEVKGLIVGLLHPDPHQRLSVYEAKRHAWCRDSNAPVEALTMQAEDIECDSVGADDSLRDDCDEDIRCYVPEEEFFRMEEDRNDIYECDSKFASSPRTKANAPPLLAPSMIPLGPYVSDLFSNFEDDERLVSSVKHSTSGYFGHGMHCEDPSSGSDLSYHSGNNPPNFNEGVKRSTRFVTFVPAADLFEHIECILRECCLQRTPTPAGILCRFESFSDSFRIEVWGLETAGAPICALQMYQMPLHSSISPLVSLHDDPTKQMYLVEFLRGQIEIFAFKRFYHWLRQSLAERIKMQHQIAPDVGEKDISLMYVSHSLFNHVFTFNLGPMPARHLSCRPSRASNLRMQCSFVKK